MGGLVAENRAGGTCPPNFLTDGSFFVRKFSFKNAKFEAKNL